jgi:hypothetical protein
MLEAQIPECLHNLRGSRYSHRILFAVTSRTSRFYQSELCGTHSCSRPYPRHTGSRRVVPEAMPRFSRWLLDERSCSNVRGRAAGVDASCVPLVTAGRPNDAADGNGAIRQYPPTGISTYAVRLRRTAGRRTGSRQKKYIARTMRACWCGRWRGPEMRLSGRIIAYHHSDELRKEMAT